MRVVISGRLAGTPGQGGATWAVLQYVLGLLRLGWDVWLVEQVPALDERTVSYFGNVVEEFGLGDRAALVPQDGADGVGVPRRGVAAAIRGADVLLNISGVLRDPALLSEARRRVYVDLDPAFTQIWHTRGENVGLEGHDRYVTIGRTLGTPECTAPTCGIDWIATNQPVVLDHWRHGGPVRRRALTTVGNWRSYGSVQHEGVHYGQRAHSMRELAGLPTLTDARLAPALAIHPDEQRDLTLLTANGWQLLDPATVAATPSSYRRFIQGSWAELGIAKAGYVDSRCGWFSDRSVCYLASGRPVLAQDTGFDAYLPTGSGLMSFRTTEEAAAGIEELRRDYPAHARAARDLAAEHFDSDRVLSALMEQVAN
jgi:hypothetical protein